MPTLKIYPEIELKISQNEIEIFSNLRFINHDLKYYLIPVECHQYYVSDKKHDTFKEKMAKILYHFNFKVNQLIRFQPFINIEEYTDLTNQPMYKLDQNQDSEWKRLGLSVIKELSDKNYLIAEAEKKLNNFQKELEKLKS